MKLYQCGLCMKITAVMSACPKCHNRVKEVCEIPDPTPVENWDEYRCEQCGSVWSPGDEQQCPRCNSGSITKVRYLTKRTRDELEAQPNIYWKKQYDELEKHMGDLQLSNQKVFMVQEAKIKELELQQNTLFPLQPGHWHSQFIKLNNLFAEKDEALQKAMETIANQQAGMATRDVEIDELKTKLGDLINERCALTSKVANLEDRDVNVYWAKSYRELFKKSDEYYRRVVNLESKVEELTSQKDHAYKQNRMLLKSYAERNGEADGLKEKLSEMTQWRDNALSVPRQELNDKNNRIHLLEREKGVLEEKLASISTDHRDLLRQAIEERNKRDNVVQELRKQLAEKDAEIEKLEKEALASDALMADHSTMLDERDDLKGRNDRLYDEIKARDAKIQALSDTIGEMHRASQKRILSQGETVATAVGAIEHTEAVVERMKERLIAKDKEIERLNAKLATLRQAYDTVYKAWKDVVEIWRG